MKIGFGFEMDTVTGEKKLFGWKRGPNDQKLDLPPYILANPAVTAAVEAAFFALASVAHTVANLQQEERG